MKFRFYIDHPIVGKHIFVCVGTTFFDDLIRTITSPIFVDIVKRNGFTSMTVQYGKKNFF